MNALCLTYRLKMTNINLFKIILGLNLDSDEGQGERGEEGHATILGL